METLIIMNRKKKMKEKGTGNIDRGLLALHITHVARIGIFIVILILLATGIGVVGATDMAKPTKIISWSNTNTEDQKTVFQVTHGEQITFSVNAEGGEKHLWLVDGIQKGVGEDSFTWTVPSEYGMWKILVMTTNSAWENWVDKEQESLSGWKERITSKYKERFIHDMIDLSVYPIEAQKEWIVSTSLTTVNPGESIQEAINNLPAEGGIVELAPGTHEVNDTMYLPGTYVYKYKNATFDYSILINRSNVTIYGTDKSIVRHHNDSVDCFYIPDPDWAATDTNLFHENIVFKGFTTTSTYTEYAGNAFISAHHVKNFTVDGMHDSCYAAYFVLTGAAPNKAQEMYKRRSENVYYKNNIVEHTRMFGLYWKHVYQLNNTLRNCQRAYGCFGSTLGCGPLHVVGNKINGGLNGGINVFVGEGPRNVRNNIVRSSKWGIWIGSGVDDVLLKDNIITGTKQIGICSRPQATTTNNLIVNNLIYNNSGHGFWAAKYGKGEKPGSESDIVNNVIYNNGGDGIRITGWAWTPGLRVRNNIIVNNKGYGINRIDGNITHSNNDVWGNVLGSYNGTTAGIGDISVDPLFADPANGNFHLKSTAGRWNAVKASKNRAPDILVDPCAVLFTLVYINLWFNQTAGPFINVLDYTWIADSKHSPCIDAGDPVEVLTEDYYTGGLTVVVDDVTEISNNDVIFITDGVNTEIGTVNSTSATTITLTETFTNNYSVANNAYVYMASSDYSNEPEPNGGRINIGAYGNTKEASKSPPPTILTFYPSSTVSDIEGKTRTFSITIDQVVNVTWLINGTQVKPINESVTEASYTNTSAEVGTWNVSAIATSVTTGLSAMQTWIWIVIPAEFDTGPGMYPSIFGTHWGKITPGHDVYVSKMYTYPCAGTGGHSESVNFSNDSWSVEANWSGYQSGDYRFITFDDQFTLEAGTTYNYTIQTGSYPQIIHNQTFVSIDGEITCTEFKDANGRVHYDWIPAIRLE